MYAIDAWRRYGYANETEYMDAVYAQRWALYDGSAFEDALRRSPFRRGQHIKIYRNTRLLRNQIAPIVDFYVAHTYAGDMSTDGKRLPDGTLGAIPIDPQTGGDESDALLRTAIAELMTAWNWKGQMGQRPMYVTALGDCMTRLVDDGGQGMPYPELIWPGYVKDLELDFVDNVKYYVLEYRVEQRDERGRATTHLYREEVDGESFRYFLDGAPWDRFGEGAVVPNPYGFVPAIWDRFTKVRGVRGMPATEPARQAIMELNSFLSHAIDHQKKVFYAPLLVSGVASRGGKREINLTTPPTSDVSREDASEFAETFNMLPAGTDAKIAQAEFDIGQTEALLERLTQGIYESNPEARFYPELREMSQLSAPGAERALGDGVSRVRRLRANLDFNTVKLFQMAISMAGYRANGGGWTAPLSRRQQAFVPYTLESYRDGLLDFTILDRPVLVPSEADRLDLMLLKRSLGVPDEVLWEEMGYDASEIERFRELIAEAEARSDRAFNAGVIA